MRCTVDSTAALGRAVDQRAGEVDEPVAQVQPNNDLLQASLAGCPHVGLANTGMLTACFICGEQSDVRYSYLRIIVGDEAR